MHVYIIYEYVCVCVYLLNIGIYVYKFTILKTLSIVFYLLVFIDYSSF